MSRGGQSESRGCLSPALGKVSKYIRGSAGLLAPTGGMSRVRVPVGCSTRGVKARDERGWVTLDGGARREGGIAPVIPRRDLTITRGVGLNKYLVM
jgi:hypothetical protein